MRIDLKAWERTERRAILYTVSGEMLAEVYPHGSGFGFEARTGCNMFKPGSITNHATVDEAVEAVDARLGVVEGEPCK